MALLNCPECGGYVSSYAMKCPHCGCPMEVIRRLIEEEKAISCPLQASSLDGGQTARMKDAPKRIDTLLKHKDGPEIEGVWHDLARDTLKGKPDAYYDALAREDNMEDEYPLEDEDDVGPDEEPYEYYYGDDEL